VLDGQDELRVGKRLLKRLAFSFNALMLGGNLLEACGSGISGQASWSVKTFSHFVESSQTTHK